MTDRGRSISSAPVPTSTTHPPGATARRPDRTATGAPEQSMNASTVIGVSPAAGSIALVAPNSITAARREATGSETTMSVAPAPRAATTVMMPIGPAPATNTLDPEPNRALRTAQTPTDNGSSSAAASSLTESGTAWAKSALIVTYSQNAPSTGGVA